MHRIRNGDCLGVRRGKRIQEELLQGSTCLDDYRFCDLVDFGVGGRLLQSWSRDSRSNPSLVSSSAKVTRTVEWVVLEFWKEFCDNSCVRWLRKIDPISWFLMVAFMIVGALTCRILIRFGEMFVGIQ